jgi:choline dehydrogenase-like flavoprotein
MHKPIKTEARMHVDVIIVGLGPTGATLAALLGQRGFQVPLLHRFIQQVYVSNTLVESTA